MLGKQRLESERLNLKNLSKCQFRTYDVGLIPFFQETLIFMDIQFGWTCMVHMDNQIHLGKFYVIAIKPSNILLENGKSFQIIVIGTGHILNNAMVSGAMLP